MADLRKMTLEQLRAHMAAERAYVDVDSVPWTPKKPGPKPRRKIGRPAGPKKPGPKARRRAKKLQPKTTPYRFLYSWLEYTLIRVTPSGKTMIAADGRSERIADPSGIREVPFYLSDAELDRAWSARVGSYRSEQDLVQAIKNA